MPLIARDSLLPDHYIQCVVSSVSFHSVSPILFGVFLVKSIPDLYIHPVIFVVRINQWSLRCKNHKPKFLCKCGRTIIAISF